MIWIFNGTALQFKDEIVEGLYSAYIECEQWLFRGHTVEPTTTGRFIDAGLLHILTIVLYTTYGGLRGKLG